MGTTSVVVIDNKIIYTKTTKYNGYIEKTGLKFMEYINYLDNNEISIEDFLYYIALDIDSRIVIKDYLYNCYTCYYTYVYDIDNKEIIVLYGNNIIYKKDSIHATYEDLEKCKI